MGKILPGVFAVGFMVMMILVITAPAWSFEKSALPAATGSGLIQADDDACLPLLKAVHSAFPNAQSGDNAIRRDAGNVAALGLLFGVRYALGPREQTRTVRPAGPEVTTDLSGMSALSVSAYRRCKNEQTIEAMNSF
jgi:hypothetical protein